MYQPLESPPALLPPKAKLVEVMNERDEPGESMKLLRSMVGGGEEGCGDALARLLGSRDYFAGRFTVADITLYDALDVSNRQVPGILAEEYPTLAAFHARVEARPNIAKWIASEDRAKIFAFPAL